MLLTKTHHQTIRGEIKRNPTRKTALDNYISIANVSIYDTDEEILPNDVWCVIDGDLFFIDKNKKMKLIQSSIHVYESVKEITNTEQFFVLDWTLYRRR